MTTYAKDLRNEQTVKFVNLRYCNSANAETIMKKLATSPESHCAPLDSTLPVVRDIDGSDFILVMPLLRPYNEPPFTTIGEVLDFLRQAFEV